MKAKFLKSVMLFGLGSFLILLGIAIPVGVQADSHREFKVAVQKIPPVMEPMRVNSNVHMRILFNVGESLLKIDYKDNMKIKPALAESWKRLDDRTIEFKLRKGVKFHNGEELTSEDVAFTFGEERFLNKERGWVLAQMYLGDINLPEVIDPYTVRISSKRTDFLLEKRLASYMSEIISKKAFLAAKDWETWSRNIVCTGPYKLAELKSGDYIKLEAFADYWGAKAPVASILFKSVPEVAARIAGLKTGEYDIATEIPPDQLKSVDSYAGISTVGGPIPNIRAVQIDSTNAVLGKKEMRQALAMAIDRQLIVDSLYYGRATVPNGFQVKMSGDMWIEDFQGLVYNPEKARELIQKAGYKGEPIHYRVMPDYYTLEVATAEILVEMWKAVGLNVKLDIVDNWSQVLKNDDTRHLVNMSHSAFYADPEGLLWRRLGPKSPFRYENIYGGKEPFCIVPEAFDKWGQQMLTTTNRQERREAIRQMLEIVETEGFQISLHTLPMFYGIRDNVVWQPYPAEFMDLTAANLSFR
ncbi:MAG: ABC transporter substrate-binding protein [bacterium]